MIRSRQLLLLLGVALVAAVVYAYLTYPRQQRVASQPSRVTAERTPKKVPSEKGQEVDGLDLARLDRKVTSSAKAKRDLFNYRLPAPAPVEEPPKLIEPVPEPKPAPKPLPVAVAVPVRSAQIVFLGFLEKEGGRHVFLSADDELFVVRPGEGFGHDRELTLVSMSTQALVISQKGRSGTFEIPLSDYTPASGEKRLSLPGARGGDGIPPYKGGHPPL